MIKPRPHKAVRHRSPEEQEQRSQRIRRGLITSKMAADLIGLGDDVAAFLRWAHYNQLPSEVRAGESWWAESAIIDKVRELASRRH